MQSLNYRFAAVRTPARPVHIGVVASGDLEILLEPAGPDFDEAVVRVRTSVDGFDTVWREVLTRFYTRTPVAGRWEIHDSGATPGVVTLRMLQAAAQATTET
jgi:malonate decarboxylase delta subunit